MGAFEFLIVKNLCFQGMLPHSSRMLRLIRLFNGRLLKSKF